jgi:hypothetical protein
MIHKNYSNITFKLFIIFFIFYIIKVNILYSQSAVGIMSNQINNDNLILFGFDKLNNTYQFVGNADIYYNLFGDSLIFNQKYKGNALKTSTTSYRETEADNLAFYIPLFSNISLLSKQNWFVSSDSKSIGINKLERINGLVGLKYNLQQNSYMEFSGGIENNNQIGISSLGSIFNFNGRLSNIHFEEFTFETAFNSEYLKLNYDRINWNGELNASLNGVYNGNNHISLMTTMSVSKKDYLSPTTDTTVTTIPVQSRYEKKILTDFNFDYAFTNQFGSFIKLSLSDLNVDMDYKNSIVSIDLSKVTLTLNELIMSAQGEMNYKSSLFSQYLGMSFYIRTEQNYLEKKFDISNDERDYLKSLQNQRDNSSSRTKLYLKSLLQPGRNDSLMFNYSILLLQYDTPSDQNNDDRDEQSMITNIFYKHKLTDELSASVNVELQLKHLVYLKSEKSAMNNWNRILTLSPAITWKTKKFMYVSQLDLIANYTVYDYDNSSNVNSFSFRQLGYRDTIYIKINNQFNIQIQNVIKYYERGIFYWNNFKENPQNSSYEQYSKILFFTNIINSLSFGSGARIYMLSQKNISQYTSVLSSSNFKQISIGPEVSIIYSMNRKSNIQLRGWYEYQSINNFDYNKIPNLFIFTYLYL